MTFGLMGSKPLIAPVESATGTLAPMMIVGILSFPDTNSSTEKAASEGIARREGESTEVVHVYAKRDIPIGIVAFKFVSGSTDIVNPEGG